MNAAEKMAAEIADIAKAFANEVWLRGDHVTVRLSYGDVVDVNVITCEDGTPLACGEIDGVMSSHFFEPIKGEAPRVFVTRITAWPSDRA